MKLLRWVFVLASIFFSIENINAQGYPAKPVHAIISFIPGSSTDIVGRVVMAKVLEYWRQPVIADNRAGAGGSIGKAAAARAPADRHARLVDSNAPAGTPSIGG